MKRHESVYAHYCRVVKRLERYRLLEEDGCVLEVRLRKLLDEFTASCSTRRYSGDRLLQHEMPSQARVKFKNGGLKSVDQLQTNQLRTNRKKADNIDNDDRIGSIDSVFRRETQQESLHEILLRSDSSPCFSEGTRVFDVEKNHKNTERFIEYSDRTLAGTATACADTLADQEFICNTLIDNALDRHGGRPSSHSVLVNLLPTASNIEASVHSMTRQQLLRMEFVEQMLEEQGDDLELNILTSRKRNKRNIALCSTGSFVARMVNTSHCYPTIVSARRTQDSLIHVDECSHHARRVNKHALDSLGRISKQCWN